MTTHTQQHQQANAALGDGNMLLASGLVLKGIIHALVGNAVLTEESGQYLHHLASGTSSFSEPATSVSEASSSFLSAQLMQFVSKLHQVHKKELMKEQRFSSSSSSSSSLSQSLIFGDNGTSSPSEEFGVGGGRGGSPVSSTHTGHTYTSKIVDAAVSEIEQCRQEQALLVQLSELETEAQTQLLKSHIDRINREHAAEVEKLRQENGDMQSSLRKMMEDELNTARANELVRLQAVTNKLKSEQTRRTQLQTRLAELEKVYQTMIAELERKNEELVLRANNAETELLRLRKENFMK